MVSWIGYEFNLGSLIVYKGLELGSANILNTTVAIGFGLYSIPMMTDDSGALPTASGIRPFPD